MKLKHLLLGAMLSWSMTGYSLFTDNYSSTIGWTQISTGVSVTGNFATYAGAADGTGRRIYKSHGQTLGNSWRYDCYFRYSGYGFLPGMGHMIAALTAGTQDPISGNSPSYTATNQDAIAMNFASDGTSTPSTFRLSGGSKNDNNAWQWSTTGVLLAVNTDYYLTLERLNQTNGRVSVYSDAARTTLVGSVCFPIDANVTTNLTELQHANNSWGNSGRQLTGVVDNSWLDNVSTTVGVTTGSQTVCALSGDPWTFTPTTPPNIGFVQGVLGYQWQISTDLINWTDIPGATLSYYDEGPGLSVETYYRRGVSVGCGVFFYNKVITVEVELCNEIECEFADDFSNAAPWTQVSTGISVTTNAAVYNNCIDATSRRIHRAHGVTLTNSWRLDFDFIYTGVGDAGPGHHLASLTAGTLDPVCGPNPFPATNQDAISAMFYSHNATDDASTFVLLGGSKNNNNAWQWSPLAGAMVLAVNTQYYISLERLDQTHGRICVYSDPARTVHIANSPQCFAIDAGVQTDLFTLQHGNTTWGWDQRSLTGEIDNDCLANLTFDGGTISEDQKIDCGGTPATLTSVTPGTVPTSMYSIGYQWQASEGCTGTWTDISGATSASYSPPALTETTCYRRLLIVTGCSAAPAVSNTVTITSSLLGTLDANFSVTASAPTGSPTYNVTATPFTTGSIWYYWEVSEVDINTGVVIPGTTMSSTTWPEPPCTFPPYTFWTDHKYKITRIIWDTCYDTSEVSWTIFHGTSLMPNGNADIQLEKAPDFQAGNTADVNDPIAAVPASFAAFPNPSGGSFAIRYDLREASSGAVAITDVHGNRLFEYALSKHGDDALIRVDDLSAGIYFIQFSVNAQLVQTEKIVVVK